MGSHAQVECAPSCKPQQDGAHMGFKRSTEATAWREESGHRNLLSWSPSLLLSSIVASLEGSIPARLSERRLAPGYSPPEATRTLRVRKAPPCFHSWWPLGTRESRRSFSLGARLLRDARAEVGFGVAWGAPFSAECSQDGIHMGRSKGHRSPSHTIRMALPHPSQDGDLASHSSWWSCSWR